MDAPRIVATGTPWVPYFSDEKRELVRMGKWAEASKIPNLIDDDHGRTYVMIPFERN